MSSTQEQILQFIRQRCEEFSPPSFRDIQKQFKFGSVGTVQDHVRALEEKGFVEGAPTKGRRKGITVAGYSPSRITKVPLIGNIVAGSPVDAEENVEAEIEIVGLPASKKFFALRVRGNSMIEASICDGDMAVIEKRRTANDGDIIAALVDGSSTLKRLRMKRDKIWLVPENKTMQPIDVTHAEFAIQGRLYLLQRKF